MNPVDEALQAGFVLDSCPPLQDARRPLTMAFHQDHDGSFLALAGLEVERFEISDDRSTGGSSWTGGSESGSAQHQPSLAVDGLFGLGHSREIAHVIATLSRPRQGALLRVGWLAFGRGRTSVEAAREAETTFNDVHAIQLAALERATLRPVVEPDALVDLIRPLFLPYAQGLHRIPYDPVAYVRQTRARTEQDPSRKRGLLPPWPARALSWTPMVSALASQPAPAGIVLRFETDRTAPTEVVEAEEQRALRLQRELAQIADAPVDTSVQLSDGADLRALVRWRLESLRRKALACRTVLTTAEPPSRGLLSVVASAFASPSASPSEPRVQWRSLESGALLEPADVGLDAEALLGAEEAHRFARTADPPDDETSALPCARARHLDLRSADGSGIGVGTANLRGRDLEVRLSERLRFQHLYLIGQTGTGKSTFMLRMIAQDIREGRGVTVVDPHGSLIDAVLCHIPKERASDVVLVDPSDLDRSVPLNPLALDEASPGAYAFARDRVIDDLLDVFDALYDLRTTGGPMFEMNFRVFTSLLLGSRKPDDYTPVLPMLETLFVDANIRTVLARRLDSVLRNSVRMAQRVGGEAALPNLAPYILSKAARFYTPLSARRMLCQNGCLDFQDILRSRKILLVCIQPAQVGKEAAALIARQVIFRLSLAAMARGTDPDQPAHFLYVDEFHNFATERFAAMLAEARKFRLGLVLAHQYTSQLIHRGQRTVLDAVLGNAGTVVAFRLGAVDAEALARVFAPRATPMDIVGLPDHVALVRSTGSLGNTPFTLRTVPVGDGDETFASLVRAQARERHTRSAELIDSEIDEAIERFRTLAVQAGAEEPKPGRRRLNF